MFIRSFRLHTVYLGHTVLYLFNTLSTYHKYHLTYIELSLSLSFVSIAGALTYIATSVELSFMVQIMYFEEAAA